MADPFFNYNFSIELDNIVGATFQECSGLDSTIDVIEHREGGGATGLTVRKLPGMVKYSNIVLKRGITGDMTLYKWHQEAVEGKMTRKNGSILILDRTGNEVARWDFINAWPTKYDGPSLNAEGTDIAIETLELAHEGITRMK